MSEEIGAWGFTFGSNHCNGYGFSLGNSYVIIEGTQEEARKAMFQARGAKWAFQYPASEMSLQAKEFGIKEVPLSLVTLEQ